MFNVQRNMYDVQGNLREVLSRLPQGVRLVAISKYHPNEYIEAAYAEGQRTFGESHEQELRQKHETLPKDIRVAFYRSSADEQGKIYCALRDDD